MIVPVAQTLYYKRSGVIRHPLKIRKYIENQRRYLVIKRSFDLLFSLSVVLFLLSWLVPLIAILIKLSSRGPVFFVQKRVGFLGRSFRCFKFRTMIVNEEANTVQAVKNDPRITAIGHFLRVSNLDELPQFFNVLRGDMSIVGPRPHMHADCSAFSEVVPVYKFRNIVKPGITGLAQVKGCRGPAKDFESIFRRYQWDSFYVRNMSFNLDLRILRLTFTSTVSVLWKKLLGKNVVEPAVLQHTVEKAAPELFPIVTETLSSTVKTDIMDSVPKRGKNSAIAYRFPHAPLTPAIPKVSAVIITHNEEKIIQETLSKLNWCDEIIIIDSGSDDRTVSICNEMGCQVFERTFKGFGEQKKFGVSKAKNDWILCIDADEVLTDDLIQEIQSELNREGVMYAGFSIPRNLVFMNRVFRFGREANDRIIRLFDKRKGNWDGAVVHESVLVNGPVKQLRSKILHYSYNDYGQYIRKLNLYSTLGAQKSLKRKAKKSKGLIVLGLPFNFFKYYIIDQNFLNGYHGFVWAALNSFYHFVKYLKMSEVQPEPKPVIPITPSVQVVEIRPQFPATS